jgi:catechol 2,3-dioxygenase-like lactoylglutathione lyase family enzyme
MDDKLLRASITGISHSGFYVEDLDRTTDFYMKVLGARVAWRNDKSKNPLMKVYIGDSGDAKNGDPTCDSLGLSR